MRYPFIRWIEYTEKTTREEQGGVYVGVGAPPTPPHSGHPLLVDLSSVDSWIINSSQDVRPKCVTPLLDFRVTQQFLRFIQKRLDAFLFHLAKL